MKSGKPNENTTTATVNEEAKVLLLIAFNEIFYPSQKYGEVEANASVWILEGPRQQLVRLGGK